MATDPTTIPSVEDLQETKEYMDNINEFVSSDNDSFVDRDGETRKTLTGMENDVQSEIDRTANLYAATVYDDTATGLANTVDGDYFSVVSNEVDDYLLLYKNNAGVAEYQKTYPSAEFFNNFDNVNESEHPAIIDNAGVELLGFNHDGSVVFKASQNVANQIRDLIESSFVTQEQFSNFEKIDEVAHPAITDSNGIELLGFNEDGSVDFKVSQNVANQVLKLINITSYDPVNDGLIPNTNIVQWGDSMTQGAGGGGTVITTVIATNLGRTVYNRGIGGQDALAIAIRQGGSDLTVTIDGDEIPASGSVSITDKNSNILSSGGVFTGTVHVTINNVSGLITTDSSGNWTFTRDSNGVNVAVDPDTVAVITEGTSFIPDPELRRADTVIIWAGRNGVVGLGREAVIKCRDNILNMVEHLTVLQKRVIVVSVCNGRRLDINSGLDYEGEGTDRYNDVIALNKELSETFKESFVDLRYYMVNHAIYDAGITPTATDLLDMDADCIPTTLLNDNVHFKGEGYEMAGDYLTRQILARGW